MRLQAAFFDIGGVLEWTPPTGWQSRWEPKLNLSPGDLDRRLEPLWQKGLVGSFTEAQFEAELAQILGLDEEHLKALTDELWQEYLGTPNTELIDYFASLDSRLKTAIISNSFVGARAREEERYGFGQMCELVIYSHEVGLAKPDPKIFHLACERMAVTPTQSIFVDDVPENITAAAALGFQAILFESTSQTIHALEELLHSTS